MPPLSWVKSRFRPAPALTGDFVQWAKRSIFVSLSLISGALCAESALQQWRSQDPWPLASALAGASVAGPGRPGSLDQNPASLARLDLPSLSYSHRPWTIAPNVDALELALPLAKFGLGLGLQSDRLGGDATATTALLGAALPLGEAAMGVGLRVARFDQSGHDSGLLVGADVGVLGRVPWAEHPLTWGASLSGAPLEQGTELKAPLFSAGARWALGPSAVSLELKASAGAFSLNAGVERLIADIVTLRAGLSSMGAEGATLGAAAGLGLHFGRDLSLDYSASPQAGPGIAHRFSLGWCFRDGWDGWSAHARLARAEAEAERRRRLKALQGERPAAAEPERQEGDFELRGQAQGREVTLSWDEPETEGDPRLLSYEVSMSLLPRAKFKPLPKQPQSARQWRGPMSLPGVTYYFRVRALNPDGSPGPLSRIRAVVLP